MKNAFLLLKLLTERFPLEKGHHAFTYDPTGILVLHLLIDERWITLHVPPGDFEREPADLMVDICAILKSTDAHLHELQDSFDTAHNPSAEVKKMAKDIIDDALKDIMHKLPPES